MKICTKCKKEKILEAFGKTNYTKCGYSSWCKDCVKEQRHSPEGRAKIAAYNKSYNAKVSQEKYRKTNKSRERNRKHDEKRKNSFSRKLYIKERNLYNNYGITIIQYKELVEKQNNACAICSALFQTEFEGHVDHDHGTKLVRGILCGNCNIGLGLFKDNPIFLHNAAKYLDNK